MGTEEAPWQTDQSIYLPFLEKSEEQCKHLRHEINDARAEIIQLKSTLDKKCEENTRLQKEINNVTMELVNSEDGKAESGGTLADRHSISALEQQIRLLTEEKDAALELAASSGAQLDHMQREYKEKMTEMQMQQQSMKAQYEQGASMATTYLSLKTRNTELEQLNAKLSSDVEQLTAKVASFSNYFKQSQQDHKLSTTQLQDLKNTQQHLQDILDKKSAECARALAGEKAREQQIEELHMALETLDQKYRHLLGEATKHQNDRKLLQEENEILKRAKEALEAREADAAKEMRDSIQLVENAVLDRDQAVIREQQKSEEITRLKAELSKLYEEAGAKTRAEVEQVRELCNKSVDKLMADVHAAELRLAETQGEVERAFREKKLVEKELEKALKHSVSGGHQQEELYERCIHAERRAEDFQMKIDNLQHHITRLNIESEATRANLEGQLSEAKARNAKLALEIEQVGERSVAVQTQLEAAKIQAQAADHARQAAVRKAAKQVASAEQDLELKVAEYEARLESTEECHRHSIGEVQKMLIAQQNLTSKWREQAKTLQSKSESTLYEMKEELTTYKKRVDELTLLLAESKRKKSETEKQVYRLQEEKARTHEQMIEYQRQAQSAQDQCAKVSKREKALTAENLKLCSELDHWRITKTLGYDINDRVKSPPIIDNNAPQRQT